MTRGTTPTHTFTTDTDLTSATVLYITYQQGGKTVVEKTLDECTVTSESVTVVLTQAETLCFSDELPVKIQIRAGFEDGSRIASRIIAADVAKILKDGEI